MKKQLKDDGRHKPMRGAQIAIKCLERANVKIIFAYPGGAALELHQALQDSNIRVILPRHEQGGAFAAAGIARATGETGVCMATSGPGASFKIFATSGVAAGSDARAAWASSRSAL